MASESPFNSPLTSDLIRELRNEVQVRMPLMDLIPLLNEHLEQGRKIGLEKPDKAYFYLMMNPDSREWRAPNGEIVLAMSKVLERLKSGVL